MTAKSRSSLPSRATRWYRGGNVPKAAIRQFARQVAEKFHPDRIILFGSHAHGTPHAGSDVDILVIMPARNQLDQAFKIRLAVTAPFSLDLIVRTPDEIRRRLEDGDVFHTAIVTKGRVLYEKGDAGMRRQGRRGLSDRRTHRAKSRTPV
jgi:predicted nucleotidyltransferase